MTSDIREEEAHGQLHRVGLGAVIADHPLVDRPFEAAEFGRENEGAPFEFWRVVKTRAIERLSRLHGLVREGTFAGSKVRLPVGEGRRMELDLIGTHEEGVFVLELKVQRSAERNAFSELFAYSNYVAGLYTMSGRRDVTNVLVATLANAITEQAYLYDLLINERDVVVYRPRFPDGSAGSLVLDLYLPSDDVFRTFANTMLSHDAMDCVAISFDDNPGWFDSEDDGGALNEHTHKYLTALAGHAAQLMEAEQLHGFCFVRKPWSEIPAYHRNTLFLCATNPFRHPHSDKADAFMRQLSEEGRDQFADWPELGFASRLIRVAHRATANILPYGWATEVEVPLWSAIVVNPVEVVYTHNFGFRTTGLLREAYTAYLDDIYDCNARGETTEDMSVMKGEELGNWLRGWAFMEACGFGTEDIAFEID